MVSLERGQELHHRSCEGEQLTVEEQAELETWYAEMDDEEARLLAANRDHIDNEELRALLNRELEALARAVEKVQVQQARNDALRNEIAALESELAARKPIAVS